MKGYFFLDGLDLYDTFGVIISKGSAEFLRLPPKKESLEHDWLDQNGVEVDLSKVYFQKREGTLQCAILATSETQFWLYRDSFFMQLTKPGLHRLELKAHPGKQYFIFYKECSNWQQTKPLNGVYAGRIGQEFSLSVVEPEPNVYNTDVQIAVTDDDGRVLIT